MKHTRAIRNDLFSAMRTIAFLTIGLCATAVLAQEIKPDRLLTYKTMGQVELKLHVFDSRIRQAPEKTAAVVFFFGGGWNGGTPRQFYEQAAFLADHGVVAISAEYRIKSKHKTTPFECVKDGKSAIRWVRAHADELGVHPNKIVAAGGSAGGHVAALYRDNQRL